MISIIKSFIGRGLNENQKKSILTFLYSINFPRDILFTLIKGVSWDSKMRFYGIPIIQNKGTISLGEGFICCSAPKKNSIGTFQRVILKTLRPSAELLFGENVQISGCTISSASSIKIGDNTLIGSGVLITDGDAHPIDPIKRLKGGPGNVSEIVVGNNVFIGARSIILKGVNIGDNCVVGAGSVVTTSFPKNCVIAGNPAKFIKKI